MFSLQRKQLKGENKTSNKLNLHTQLYQEQVEKLGSRPILPKRKSVFKPNEDLTPYLNDGEFVKVKARTVSRRSKGLR